MTTKKDPYTSIAATMKALKRVVLGDTPESQYPDIASSYARNILYSLNGLDNEEKYRIINNIIMDSENGAVHVEVWYLGLSEFEMETLLGKYRSLKNLLDSNLTDLLNNDPKVDKIKDKSEILKKALGKYGFFDLLEKKGIDADKTVNLMINNDIPYMIAMLNHLGFDNLILKEYASNVKSKMHKILAEILGTTERRTKGNINVLHPFSKEDRATYTAHLYSEMIKKDLS